MQAKWLNYMIFLVPMYILTENKLIWQKKEKKSTPE